MAGSASRSSAATGSRRTSGASTPPATRRRRSRSATSTGCAASRARPAAARRGPTKEYFLGLAEMYVADERFGANYGGQAGAEFVRDAMTVYAERNL